jgi:hypothetical protein
LPAFVLDKRKKPPLPCCQKRAWLLLTPGRAVMPARHPFTIRLKDRVGGAVWPVRVKVGDMVRVEATIHAGRVAVGGSRSFKVGNAGAINATCCKLLDRADSCGYAWCPALPPPAEAGAVRRGRRR